MSTLLDANVLVYASDTTSPRFRVCADVLNEGIYGALDAVLVPQVLLEFYATVTRASAARPLTAEQGWRQVEALKGRIPVLSVKVDSLSPLGRFVGEHELCGPRVFDVFLAAQMKSHGISRICTDNVRHFAALEVDARTPEQVLAGR